MQLYGVGKVTEKQLARLNLFSVEDLLFHFPYRYENRTVLTPIRQMTPETPALIQGTIRRLIQETHGRTQLLCELSDDTGTIYLRFLHAPFFMKKLLIVGRRLRAFGVCRFGQMGRELIHPEFQVIPPGKVIPPSPILTSFYHTTQGLSQFTLRKIIHTALQSIANHPQKTRELLPDALRLTQDLPSFVEAMTCLHEPPADSDLSTLMTRQTKWQKRLIIEEMIAHRLSLLAAKKHFKQRASTALKVADNNALQTQFKKALPFTLTHAQERVLNEIHQDLAQGRPMLRLLQGDVGAGKTVVAALTMLAVSQHGHQAALMAPTELLANQHYETLSRWFQPLGITVALLSSQLTAKEKKKTLLAIQENQAQIIVGTHALLQKNVAFSKLALIIIDEQHRFGVQQRALLREKSVDECCPHQLIMTATPIPRTLAMSIYADLDCSVIDELPKHKATITTHVLANQKRDAIIERLRENCQSGKQAYWVCPLIEESEIIHAQDAIQTTTTLQNALPTLNIALIHGRMKPEEKERTMSRFQAGEIHVLVATTVIEVGIDVPNASIMVIENAERLGLAQLHQLRGRIGRGTIASHCILLYDAPLSPVAKSRLSIMRETTDGFKIAEHDLKLRGPGEIFGEKQKGALTFKIADLASDAMLSMIVKEVADRLSQQEDHAHALIARWIGELTEAHLL